MAQELVVACIPYFNARRYVVRAVESLLAQTHRDLCVVVVNDGDEEPPWDLLAHVDDPRLVRFNLPFNEGPYFACDVVLKATSARYFLLQDADDWSDPRRVESLLRLLRCDGSDLAISAQPQFCEEDEGVRTIDVRWCTQAEPGRRLPFAVDRSLTSEFRYRAPHHGLFRTESLHRIGGYYAGFKFGYDTLLTNLILMTGRVSHSLEPLYHRMVHAQSLTQDADTGFGSRSRLAIQQRLRLLYAEAFELYSGFSAGRIGSADFLAGVRRICDRPLTEGRRSRLKLAVHHLGTILN